MTVIRFRDAKVFIAGKPWAGVKRVEYTETELGPPGEVMADTEWPRTRPTTTSISFTTKLDGAAHAAFIAALTPPKYSMARQADRDAREGNVALKFLRKLTLLDHLTYYLARSGRIGTGDGSGVKRRRMRIAHRRTLRTLRKLEARRAS